MVKERLGETFLFAAALQMLVGFAEAPPSCPGDGEEGPKPRSTPPFSNFFSGGAGHAPRHVDRVQTPERLSGEYVARKFVITKDSYGPSNELISSRSLRDMRNLLRSLYRGWIQLKRPSDDEPNIGEVWL